MKILMLHGINHNMFGKRDPKQYGTITLDEINANLTALGQRTGHRTRVFPNQQRRRYVRSHSPGLQRWR